LPRPIAPRIKIGSSVWIGKDTWLNVSPTDETDEPKIVIEDNVKVCAGTQISAKNSIHIGHDALISSSVLIQDHLHGYEDITRPIQEQPITEGGRIRIGQGSWIGRGAAILCTRGELILGQHCVVGANAVVLQSFPPYSVVFGNPARVIRQFDPAKNAWVIGSVHSTPPTDATKKVKPDPAPDGY
jgi:acetyltransferase-like isoleucine patch superfamily enzyme